METSIRARTDTRKLINFVLDSSVLSTDPVFTITYSYVFGHGGGGSSFMLRFSLEVGQEFGSIYNSNIQCTQALE